MMDWLQILSMALFFVGSMGLMCRKSYKEMKDFHGRLCKLEEKYQQMMERFLERNKNKR